MRCSSSSASCTPIRVPQLLNSLPRVPIKHLKKHKPEISKYQTPSFPNSEIPILNISIYYYCKTYLFVDANQPQTPFRICLTTVSYPHPLWRPSYLTEKKTCNHRHVTQRSTHEKHNSPSFKQGIWHPAYLGSASRNSDSGIGSRAYGIGITSSCHQLKLLLLLLVHIMYLKSGQGPQNSSVRHQDH